MLGTYEFPLLIFVVSANALLGGIVFFKNSKSSSNRIFTLLCLCFSLWAMVNYFSVHPPFGEELIWIRLVMLTAAPQIALFFLFVNTFPHDRIQLSNPFVLVVVGLLLVQMSLAVSPWVFSSIIFDNGKVVPQPGWGLIFYGTIVAFLFLSGVYRLLKRFYSAKDRSRTGLAYIVAGFSVTAALLVAFLFIAVAFFKNTSFVPFSHLFVLPFIIAASFAIIRQGFLDIKIIATEFLVGLFAIALLIEALTSVSLLTIIWKLLFSLFVVLLGYLLVKSVYKEIERREQVTELAKSLESANTRLQELDRQKTDFLSIAAHQLRTPLSIINGYIELLHDGAYGAVTKEALEIYKNIDESNEHLVKLVDSFLDITRLEQGRTKYDFAEHDINAVIESAIKELGVKAKQKNIEIAFITRSGPARAIFDEEKIRHVIFNFIDNSIKYCDQGGIEVSAVEEGDGIAVRVSDTGIGFDKIDEVNFFQKFYRGNNVRGINVNGTGLGLFVCAKFIEAHNGRVWARSAGIGKGSEFGFWIPLRQR